MFARKCLKLEKFVGLDKKWVQDIYVIYNFGRYLEDASIVNSDLLW